MTVRKIVENTEQTLKEYEAYLRDEERSRATVEKYVRDVRKFMGFLAGDVEIEKEKVREYKEMLMEQYKITSANSMLAAMNNFFVFLGRTELKVKLFKIQRSTYSSPEKEMTEKDYAGLIKAARADGDERMSMLLQTLGSTGIRISELRFITVEAVNAGRAEIYNKGKMRVILLPSELTRLLKTYCRKMEIRSGSIFITRNGRAMDRSNISKRMKQLGREAGVDAAKIFPHNLRHLFARVFYSIEKEIGRAHV